MLCNRNICTQATDLFKEQAHSQWQQTRHGPAAWTSRLPPVSVRTGLRTQTAATTGPLYLEDKYRGRLAAAGSNSSTHRLFCHDNHHIQLNIMKLQAKALHMKFKENPTTHPQISLILQSQNSVGTRPFLWSSIRNSSMRPSADIDVQALSSKDHETKIKINISNAYVSQLHNMILPQSPEEKSKIFEYLIVSIQNKNNSSYLRCFQVKIPSRQALIYTAAEFHCTN